METYRTRFSVRHRFPVTRRFVSTAKVRQSKPRKLSSFALSVPVTSKTRHLRYITSRSTFPVKYKSFSARKVVGTVTHRKTSLPAITASRGVFTIRSRAVSNRNVFAVRSSAQGHTRSTEVFAVSTRVTPSRTAVGIVGHRTTAAPKAVQSNLTVDVRVKPTPFIKTTVFTVSSKTPSKREDLIWNARTRLNISHRTYPLTVLPAAGETQPIAEVVQKNIIAPRRSTFTVTHNSIYILGDTSLPGSITVSQVENADLAGSIAVRQPGEHNQESSLTVRRSNTSSISGSVSIKRVGETSLNMAVRIRSPYTYIDGQLGYNVNSSIRVAVVHKSDLPSWLGVRYRTKMTGETTVIGVGNSTLTSAVTVSKPYDMPSSLGVAPTNRMSGIISIVEPFIFRDVATPTKDSFVRESLPRLNYGGEQIIGAGYLLGREERLRAMMGFDIHNFIGLPTQYELKKAELRVHYAYLPPTVELALYETYNDWTEYGVTWENQPEQGLPVSSTYTVNPDEKYISFDISEYVNEARQFGKRYPNFYLKTVSDTGSAFYFFSKEREAGLEPKVIIEYFDGRIWSFGTANIPSSIRAVIPATRDLKSRLNVFTFNDKLDMESRMFIAESGFGFRQLDSTLRISRPDAKATVTVRQAEKFDMESSIAVREYRYDDLENLSITVNRPDLWASVLVKHYKDMPSTVTVRVAAYEEVPSFIAINGATRPGSIYVIPYKDWPGTISVRRGKQEDQRSILRVSTPQFKGSVYVRYRNDLSGTIEVRSDKSLDIKGSIAASVPSLVSSIKVKPYYDVRGVIRVRRDTEDTWPSVLRISRPDIKASVYVLHHSDLESSIAVRRTGGNEWQSHLKISRPDLPSSVYVRYRYDIESSIAVRRSNESERESTLVISRPNLQGSIHPIIHFPMPSVVAVRRSLDDSIRGSITVPHRKDLPGRLDVWQKSDLPSTIDIFNPQYYIPGTITIPAYDEDDLPSEFYVRVTRVSDLPSVINVWQFSTLPSRVAVRKSGTFDVTGKVTVRRSNWKAIPASINVIQFKTLPSKVAVRRSYETEIASSIDILHRNDLPGQVLVKWRDYLSGSILVVINGHSDLPGILVPRVRAPFDIPTTMTVVMSGESNLKSSITVPAGNRMTGKVGIIPVGDYDTPSSIHPKIHAHLKGSITVRVQDKLDIWSTLRVRNDGEYNIPCTIQTRIHFDIRSTISIRRSAWKDVGGRIEVRARKHADLPSTIQPRLHSNLPSKLYVLYRSNLTCTIEVITAYPYSYIM